MAALSEECVRERRSMTSLPPTYYLHVWFARRPLVASRAAILGCLLPADASRDKFLHDLGIHGDPVAAARAIAGARASGVRVENPYDYQRAFYHLPPPVAEGLCVLDPTAGGGSIPFEAIRVGADTIGNDLNPVASFVLKTTVELPLQFGASLLKRFDEFAAEFLKRAKPLISEVFPDNSENREDATFLWTRTVTCPYCGGVVPLSPNWKLSGSGLGVRLVPENGRVRFEIVEREADHSPGAVKGGDGSCPFPECRRTIDGDEVKAQAQAGGMGHQLYCVVYKEERIKGYTRNGKPKTERVRGFRAPRPQDDVEALVSQRLEENMPLWQARNIVPDEEIPFGYETMIRWPLDKYGLRQWTDFFSPRQLYGHCVGVQVFKELAENFVKSELDRAAMAYLAISLDKMVNYNAIQVRWHASRAVVAGVFDRHDFSFKWTYAEMAPTIPGLGYDWAFEQAGKALRELIDLLGQSSDGKLEFRAPRPKPHVRMTCASADALPLEDGSVDCVVMDPPYYDDVMYAKLSYFFYVWLKRTAGLLYPELFTGHLTDKDREAVANPARFVGEKGGAKNLAGRDYQRRMAAIFTEQRRVLKPDGIMVVMFTHKASGAWDALAGGLIEGGFTITASWPINTEAEASMHIREKSAAHSTIFLVCRVREADSATAEPRYLGRGGAHGPPSRPRQSEGVPGRRNRRHRPLPCVLWSGTPGVHGSLAINSGHGAPAAEDEAEGSIRGIRSLCSPAGGCARSSTPRSEAVAHGAACYGQTAASPGCSDRMVRAGLGCVPCATVPCRRSTQVGSRGWPRFRPGREKESLRSERRGCDLVGQYHAPPERESWARQCRLHARRAALGGKDRTRTKHWCCAEPNRGGPPDRRPDAADRA